MVGVHGDPSGPMDYECLVLKFGKRFTKFMMSMALF